MNKKTDAAVVFISGQSNAHAHGRRMDDSERITTPLKNVFALDRNPNQSFDITDVSWSGYTTEGKNLGETQDNTYSLAYFLAKLWQEAIDCGKRLPDLYIVQMSVGSQGIINGMWNRDKEKVLKPGILGKTDIALFPLALHIFPLVTKNLKAAGKHPEVIGWHWLGCEQEIWDEAYLRRDFNERYDFFFDSVKNAISKESFPVYFYEAQLEKACERFSLPQEAAAAVNAAILRQHKRFEGSKYTRATKSPYFDKSDAHFGILAEDNAHYLGKVQRWFAEKFFYEVTENVE